MKNSNGSLRMNICVNNAFFKRDKLRKCKQRNQNWAFIFLGVFFGSRRYIFIEPPLRRTLLHQLFIRLFLAYVIVKTGLYKILVSYCFSLLLTAGLRTI